MHCSSRRTPGRTPPCGSRCSTRIRRRESPSRCARCGCHASRAPRQRRTGADATGGAALQIKTTASSTYRVWPNCGPLEPGETQRVQILLLGTKVSSRRPSPPPPTLPEPIRRLPGPLPAHCPARPSMSASESALPLPPVARWRLEGFDSAQCSSPAAALRCEPHGTPPWPANRQRGRCNRRCSQVGGTSSAVFAASNQPVCGIQHAACTSLRTALLALHHKTKRQTQRRYPAQADNSYSRPLNYSCRRDQLSAAAQSFYACSLKLAAAYVWCQLTCPPSLVESDS